MSKGWYGVDLDGTLAHWETGKGWGKKCIIGAPIPAMVERVKQWLSEGKTVKIMTARVSGPIQEAGPAYMAIVDWCMEHIGKALPITHSKDYNMIVLWDDRCVHVEHNTGRILG